MEQLVFDQFSSNFFIVFLLSTSIVCFFLSIIICFIEIISKRTDTIEFKVLSVLAILSFSMIILSSKVIGSDYEEISAKPESYFDLIRNDNLLEFESKDDRLQSTTLVIEDINFNTIYARSKERNKIYAIERKYLQDERN
mgnify:CR=1 FL=1